MPRTVLFILLLSASANGLTESFSTSTALDLFSVYKLALDNAPELQIAREKLKAEKEVFAKSRAGLLPAIAVSAEYARVEQRVDEIGGLIPASDNHYPRNAFQVTLTQPLFSLQNWHTFQAGKAQAREARARYRESLQAFRMSVVEAYFQTLRAKSKLVTRNTELEAVRRQHQQIEKQLSAGMVSILDVHEISAEVKRVEVMVIRAEGEVDQKLRSLQSLTARPIHHVQDLATFSPQLPADSLSLSQWIEKAKASNPRLNKVRLTVQTARKKSSEADSAHYPELSLSASYHREAASAANSGALDGEQRNANTASIGVKLQMPLYSGGRTSANQREASHRYLQAKEEYRQVHQDVLNNLHQQFRAAKIQRRAIAAAKDALAAQDLALRAAQKGYDAGVRDLVDVVRARRERFKAVEVFNAARFDLIMAITRLSRLGGTLDEAQLKHFNQWVSSA